MEKIDRLKKRYPEGTRISLVYINDRYCKLSEGDKGTVVAVDDIGQIHVQFDDSIQIGLNVDEDVFNVIR